MLQALYSSPRFLHEIKQSPLAPLVERFANDHFNEGYELSTIKTKLNLIIKFMRWMAYNSIKPTKLKRRHVEKFKEALIDEGTTDIYRQEIALSRFLSLVDKRYHLALVERKLSRFNGSQKIQLEVDRFEKYLNDERGLTKTSIVRFTNTVRQFLTFVFSNSVFAPKKIMAKDVLNFLKERGKLYKDRTLRTDGSAIKCYLRLLYGTKVTKTNLSHAVPSFSVWRNQNVIHTISEAEMIKMLNSCDQDSTTGVRDYAVLLLLMRYGLRPIEIIDLKILDILWDEKKLVVQGKGKKSVLPLVPDIEQALKRYIDCSRPKSKCPEVFIRKSAPHVRFSKSGAVSAIVKRTLGKCNLAPKISGGRLLRYSAASIILNKGGTLQEVSELLRHSSINTSVRYTRLDMKRLNLVALAWPTTWEKSA